MQMVAGIVVGLVLVWLVLIGLFWVLRPKDVGLREAVAVVPDALRLIRDLLRDGRTPPDVRAVLIVLLLWLLSPIDLIPEFIPVLGPLDDVVVAVIALRYTRRRLGIERLRERWLGSETGFALLARVLGPAD